MLSMMPLVHPFAPMMIDMVASDLFMPVHVRRDEPQVSETDDTVTVTIMAPGVAAEDIEVTYEDEGVLKIAGQSSTRAVNFTVKLSDTLAAVMSSADATASHMDGILTISIPKAEADDKVEEAVTIVPNAADTRDMDAESTYSLAVVAPGIAAADLLIQADKRVLTVRGESKHTRARLAQRTFGLPRDADIAKSTATHVDGILTITIPKKATPLPKRIAVRSSVNHPPAKHEEAPSGIHEHGTNASANNDAMQEEAVMV